LRTCRDVCCDRFTFGTCEVVTMAAKILENKASCFILRKNPARAPKNTGFYVKRALNCKTVLRAKCEDSLLHEFVPHDDDATYVFHPLYGLSKVREFRPLTGLKFYYFLKARKSAFCLRDPY